MVDLMALTASEIWLHTGLNPSAAALAAAQALLVPVFLLCAYRLEARRSEAGFWLAAAALMALLALMGLLRAERAWVLWVREMTQSIGWYSARRPLQWMASAALLAALLMLVLQLPAWARRLQLSRGLLTAACGLALLLTVELLRLVSLHHIDMLLDARTAGLSAGRWLQLGALLLLGSGGLDAARHARRGKLQGWRRV